VITGVVTTILGPVLPVFIARWSLDDAQAGFFFTMQFAGSLAGSGLSSFLLSRRGYRSAFVAGYALMAAGIASLNISNHHVVLAATAVFGAGFGLVIPGTNLWVGENSGAKRSSASKGKIDHRTDHDPLGDILQRQRAIRVSIVEVLMHAGAGPGRARHGETLDPFDVGRQRAVDDVMQRCALPRGFTQQVMDPRERKEPLEKGVALAYADFLSRESATH
jgi:hypothetical protein